VVAGLKGDTSTQIVSGLKAGQQVVTSTGATLFSSGSALTGCDPEGPHMIGVFIRNAQGTLKRNRIHGVHLDEDNLDCDNGSAVYAQGAGTAVRITLLNNALHAANPNDVLVLSGNFDWTQARHIVHLAIATGCPTSARSIVRRAV
jgi:hypothetical protein